jgi:4-amino-4-deoxy-L-arabinose transferase-like glycosyltransferase
MLWAYLVISTHPKNAIISWDEGFHSGAALYLSRSLQDNGDFQKYSPLFWKFINGSIWYPPLWHYTAGSMGALLQPSLEIYRTTTTIFALASLVLTAWFTKKYATPYASLIATVTLATTPLFIIYSHLSMLEIPQLLCIALALLSYFYFITKENVTNRDVVQCTLAFTLGVLGKIVSIFVILGTITLFALYLQKHKNLLLYKRVYSKYTLLFLAAALTTTAWYRQRIIDATGNDILLFYATQSTQISGQTLTIQGILTVLLQNITFYTKEFRAMPLLSLIWIISTIGYLSLKKSALGAYLVVWILITYLIFSSVKPQAAQYILSLHVPLSIMTGLFAGEILNKAKHQYKVTIAVCTVIALLGIKNVHNSQAIVWRTHKTYQEEATKYIRDHANKGESVATSGDGNLFLLELYNTKNQIKTINAAIYKGEIPDDKNISWVLKDFGPHNPIEIKFKTEANWKKVKSFGTKGAEEIIYHRINNQ